MNNWEERLRIMLASFAMYLANDNGPENDRHEEEIAKFESFISDLLKKQREGYVESLLIILDSSEDEYQVESKLREYVKAIEEETL